MLNYWNNYMSKWHSLFFLGTGFFISSFWMTGTPEMVFNFLAFLGFAGSLYLDNIKPWLNKEKDNG